MSQRRSQSKKTLKQTKQSQQKAATVLPPAWYWSGYLLIVPFVLLALAVYLFASIASGETKTRRTIENATKNNRFGDAEKAWKSLALANPKSISPKDRIAWATAALRADHPGAAISILDAWKSSNSEAPDGWLLILDLLRVLGDADLFSAEVESLLQSPVAMRTTSVLSSATLGLLTDLDQAEVRSRLKRWVENEPDHPLAQAALLLRYALNPLPEDPSRDERLKQARELLLRFPDSSMARSALAETLFNSGLYEEVAVVLDGWPNSQRVTTSWHRLQGRRLQDLIQKPEEAVAEYQLVLKSMPHDWKTRYRLARALMAGGIADEARQQAHRMTEIRELLEPTALEPVLKRAMPKGRPPEPAQMVPLLQKIELNSLAKSWLEWQASQRFIQPR